MRVKKLSMVFLMTCIIGVIFLYVMMDISLWLPSIRPAQDIDQTKWSSIESKIRHLENLINKHKEVVGDIKFALKRKDTKDDNADDKSLRKPRIKIHKQHEIISNIMHETPKKLDLATCPMKESVPKTDIQMLTMYDRIMFDDVDGGVWKQGWEIKYNETQWSSANKLKVFIVPHSHNDPGWLKTFEEYYKMQTKAIFTNMIEKLPERPGRKFIWAEVSYLALWWDNDATDKEKAIFKGLLNSGQIEIVTGGWVMNDEANSHWLSVVQQLTTGHQWLASKLGYVPRHGWAIDPFGHSAAQPLLLRRAGMAASVIQRVHYRIKKELAKSKQLEFRWRQLWDGAGATDMFTHMMPFYSYDVSHTCGPDPKICCQFDFRRLPGNGMQCPWGFPPKNIIQKNVRERSSLILDQWRKKAQLYRSNLVLIPLGDDFRYDRSTEWDHQYHNYEAIIDFINNENQWNTEVQFGTLSDYFGALKAETRTEDFPVLSGDMFTYADRVQHYWSGYYTSRPFYKRMDRTLLAYVRAAESITAQATITKAVSRVLSLALRDRVELARRSLALFQHHDGITGTSTDKVREDYAKKMHAAIKYCQSAIQQAAYFMMGQPLLKSQKHEDIFLEVDEVWRTHDELPTRLTIQLDQNVPLRRLVLHNPLVFSRTELVSVLVNSPDVEVTDESGAPVNAQVSPVVLATGVRLSLANKYRLSFLATVPPLALAAYTVALRKHDNINKYTSYARVRIYNADYWTVDLPKMFVVEQPSARLNEDLSVSTGTGVRVVASPRGLLKAITMGATTTPVHMDYVWYDSKKGVDDASGAYLFLPTGPAQELKLGPYPEIVVLEGPLEAFLHADLTSPDLVDIILTLTVTNNPSLPQAQVKISNTLLVNAKVDNIEVAMRFASTIQNGDVFYTDVNGMQMIKRQFFKKLPIQANFYPLPAAAYIEDESTRLTILTSTPLGVAALQSGQIEVMQDRRLSHDDNRGLGQGVQDNVRTRHSFRLIVETRNTKCNRPIPSPQPYGLLTTGAHVAAQMLLTPLVLLQYDGDMPVTAERPKVAPAADLVLASLRSHVTTLGGQEGVGVTLQRVALDDCYGGDMVAYPHSDGQVWLSSLGVPSPARHSSLTYTALGGVVAAGVLTLCPMEMRSVFANYSNHKG